MIVFFYLDFQDNGEFLARLQHHLSDKNWKMLMTGFKKGVNFFQKSAEIGKSGLVKSRRKLWMKLYP